MIRKNVLVEKSNSGTDKCYKLRTSGGMYIGWDGSPEAKPDFDARMVNLHDIVTFCTTHDLRIINQDIFDTTIHKGIII